MNLGLKIYLLGCVLGYLSTMGVWRNYLHDEENLPSIVLQKKVVYQIAIRILSLVLSLFSWIAFIIFFAANHHKKYKVWI